MSLASTFEEYAAWYADSSPLYRRLAHGVADDPELLDVAAAAPDDQPAPNNLLAAVHALVLDDANGSDHLAAFYPSVVDEPVDPDERDPVPAFRSFVLDHEDAVRKLVATRRTQTNAVGRSSVLYPAFARLDDGIDEPITLVEVGASAGLNLRFDRFRYRYRFDDDSVREVGAAALEGPIIDAEVRSGWPPLPPQAPAVDSRVGIDVNPLDVTDDDDVRWLQALVWPEHADRHDRLREAIAITREDPPEVVAGNALEVLPTVVAGLPDDRPVCVFDTLVLYQLTAEQRERYRSVLAECAGDRELHWLSGRVPADRDVDDTTLELRHARIDGGSDDVDASVIATFESHGRWLRWHA